MNLHRPYLVIPKLIDQPTWGGQYIVATKGWIDRKGLGQAKIGQSYELFSGSNLSLLSSSEDPLFAGEFTDRDAVQVQTAPENSIPLSRLLDGSSVFLIKFTQALGNSFQVHIKAGLKHDVWKPKPESWYYFEPGLITLGVKPGVDWVEYQAAVTTVQSEVSALGEQVQAGSLSYAEAQGQVKAILAKYDPWQFVNTVPVKKNELIDLSGGGLHHSWEEDPVRAPLGNVLYELQVEAMDDISTFRNFDKGKMGADGSVRDVHIKEYFEFIDRTPMANDPASHVVQASAVSHTESYEHDHLLATSSYNLDQLKFLKPGAVFTEQPGRFKHLFVKSGKIKVAASGEAVTVTTGHSCFVPAAAGEYSVENLAGDTEVLVSY